MIGLILRSTHARMMARALLDLADARALAETWRDEALRETARADRAEAALSIANGERVRVTEQLERTLAFLATSETERERLQAEVAAYQDMLTQAEEFLAASERKAESITAKLARFTVRERGAGGKFIPRPRA